MRRFGTKKKTYTMWVVGSIIGCLGSCSGRCWRGVGCTILWWRSIGFRMGC
ncbi:hypothetical protein Tdes44962_MAKER10317, partial [Teratosphaeria destructans]